MTATRPELAGLLRDVLERPHDDATRLIYADWCEDNGDPLRAELIRVQVELARWEMYPGERFTGVTSSDGRRLDFAPTAGLAARERELLWADEWEGYSRWAFAWLQRVDWDNTLGPGTPALPGCRFRRGFIGHIELPLAAFQRCAKEIFSAQPVTSVKLTDREPLGLDDVARGWRMGTPATPPAPNVIPQGLFSHLRVTGQSGLLLAVYKDLNESFLELSSACVAFGRDLAGLPPLESAP